jgi:Tfp pilus assembly PilM family ATPase
MAHTVCGVDLGTYSVKLAFVEVGFRTSTLRGLTEVPVPAGEAPLIERQLEAVREGLSQVAGEVTPYMAMSGDQLSVRVLQLPFSDPRKVDQVVGYELEGQIVNAIEDVVFDHLVVDQRPEGATVLAAAAKRDDVAAFVAAAEAHEIHPRALFAAPVVYRTLFAASGTEKAPEPAAEVGEPEGEAEPCQAVIDFGHQRTNICIVRNGQAVYARTIRRGSAQLTDAIAKAFNADFERAEQAKREDAFLVSPGRPATSPLAAKLDTVLREALAPTIRELRQTLASVSAGTKLEVKSLLVVGGGGRLGGLLPFLEAELGIPAHFLAAQAALSAATAAPAGGLGEAEAAPPESDAYALAAAIVLAASGGSREIDFRRGAFVYRASFSVLRQKAVHLAMLGVALLVFGFVDVWAKLSNLKDERRLLDKELKTATTELFGQPREDAEAIAQLLRRGYREELAPTPKATAFDLLDAISRKVPPADKIKLDIAELDIRPKKTFIKGTADSGAAVDEIATKLKEIDCFEDVAKGAITEVSGGEKQFTLTVNARCP